jgi:hypothetical protein
METKHLWHYREKRVSGLYNLVLEVMCILVTPLFRKSWH